jgi:hypothetical protein
MVSKFAIKCNLYRYTPVDRGSAVVEQGEDGTSMFVLVQGGAVQVEFS